MENIIDLAIKSKVLIKNMAKLIVLNMGINE